MRCFPLVAVNPGGSGVLFPPLEFPWARRSPPPCPVYEAQLTLLSWHQENSTRIMNLLLNPLFRQKLPLLPGEHLYITKASVSFWNEWTNEPKCQSVHLLDSKAMLTVIKDKPVELSVEERGRSYLVKLPCKSALGWKTGLSGYETGISEPCNLCKPYSVRYFILVTCKIWKEKTKTIKILPEDHHFLLQLSGWFIKISDTRPLL